VLLRERQEVQEVLRGGVTPLRGRLRPARLFSAGALALTLALRLFTLLPELAHPHGMLNDMVLHDAAIRAASRAMARGEGPIDAWLGATSVGYPFLRQYQPASHVVAATVHFALGGRATASQVRAWLVALALLAFPLAVYRASRDIGLGRVGAAFAASCAPLLEAPLLLGLTDQAYLWRGYGLYSQALCAPFFVLAIGRAARALEKGRGEVGAGLLLAAALVTHFIFGWLAAVLIGAIAVLATAAPLTARAVRLAAIAAVAGAASAFILLPAISTAAYGNHSAIEPAEKWDGYGFRQLRDWLVEGRLLDGDAGQKRAVRFPVATVLSGLGLGLALARLGLAAAGAARRLLRPEGRPLLAGAAAALSAAACGRVLVILVVSAVLLAGRRAGQDADLLRWVPAAYDWIPGAKYLHLQRMIAGVHLAAILLAGVLAHAVAAALAAAERRPSPSPSLERASAAALAEPSPHMLAVAFGALGASILPAALERIAFCRQNGESAHRAEEGVLEPEVVRLFERTAACASGRVYAGHGRIESCVTKLAEGVPLDAATAARDLETLGHLWHPFAIASDVYYFRFRPEESIDAETFAVTRFLLPERAPPPPHARRVDAARGIVLYERPDIGWFALASAPRRVEVAPRDAYPIIVEWFDGLERKLGVAPLLALDGERWEPAGSADRPPEGFVFDGSIEDDRFRAHVALEEPGYLVVKVAYHPALGALVDGAPAPLACVMPGFAAVRVEPGRHEVEVRVVPDRRRIWLLLGGIGAVAAIALLLERVRRPLSPAGEGAPAVATPPIPAGGDTPRAAPEADSGGAA
jgi:hypothetical protein